MNKKGKEVWAYCNTIKRARNLQDVAKAKGIDSNMFVKRENRYELV